MKRLKSSHPFDNATKRQPSGFSFTIQGIGCGAACRCEVCNGNRDELIFSCTVLNKLIEPPVK